MTVRCVVLPFLALLACGGSVSLDARRDPEAELLGGDAKLNKAKAAMGKLNKLSSAAFIKGMFNATSMKNVGVAIAGVFTSESSMSKMWELAKAMDKKARDDKRTIEMLADTFHKVGKDKEDGNQHFIAALNAFIGQFNTLEKKAKEAFHEGAVAMAETLPESTKATVESVIYKNDALLTPLFDEHKLLPSFINEMGTDKFCDEVRSVFGYKAGIVKKYQLERIIADMREARSALPVIFEGIVSAKEVDKAILYGNKVADAYITAYEGLQANFEQFAKVGRLVQKRFKCDTSAQ